MKNLLLFIFTALMVVSCGCNDTRRTVNENTVRKTYTFETSYRLDEHRLCDALILDCKSGEKSQQFTFEFNWSKDKGFLEMEGSGEISEEDINGDGYPDVVVCLGDFGVLSTLVFYGACLWNEETQQFDLVEKYSDIPNAKPRMDADKSIIASEYVEPDGTYCVDYYDWEDGKLVLTNSDSQTIEED